MSTEKKWYVYLLCDPDTEEPFYVGKGSGNRIDMHETALTRYLDGNNAAKKRRISQIIVQGKDVLKKKIAEFDNEQDALIYEWGMICFYGEMLTNIKGSRGILREKTKGRGPKLTREEKDGLISAKGAAKLLGVSRRTLIRLMEEGQIPSYRISCSRKFKPSEVRQYRDSCRYQPTS